MGVVLLCCLDLAGRVTSKLAIAVGDLNNDGMLDIVVGNDNQMNFYLMGATAFFSNERLYLEVIERLQPELRREQSNILQQFIQQT